MFYFKYHSYQLLNQYETKLTNDMWYCGLIKKYPDEQSIQLGSQKSSAETSLECSVTITGNKLPHPEIKP